MCNTPHCCLPQESGPCLSPSVAAHPLRPATRHRLGGPSPHQQADRPRAHPPPKHPKMKLSRPGPCGPAGTPRISRPFKRLSRRGGQVTHVILTRSPLNPPPKKGAGPFDLHVLSTPPAFVLSQDQTLQTKTEQPQPKQARAEQQKPEKKPQPNPTPPQTPNPDKTTKTNTGTRRTESAERKKTRPTPHHPTRRRRTGRNPTPAKPLHDNRAQHAQPPTNTR